MCYNDIGDSMIYFNGKEMEDYEYDKVLNNIKAIVSGVITTANRSADEIKARCKFNRKVYEKELKKTGILNRQELANQILKDLDTYHELQKNSILDKKINAFLPLCQIEDKPCISIANKKNELQKNIKTNINHLLDNNTKTDVKVETVYTQYGVSDNQVYDANDNKMVIREVTEIEDVNGKRSSTELKKTGLQELTNIYFASLNLERSKINIDNFEPLFDDSLKPEQKLNELLELHTPQYSIVNLTLSPAFDDKFENFSTGDLKNNPDFINLKNRAKEIKQALSDYCRELTTLANMNLTYDSILALEKILEEVPNNDPYKQRFLEKCDKKKKQLTKDRIKQNDKVNNCQFDPNLVNQLKEIEETLQTMQYDQTSKTIQDEKDLKEKEDLAKNLVSEQDLERMKQSMTSSQFNRLVTNIAHNNVYQNQEMENENARRI